MLKPFSRESEIRKKEKLQEKNQRKRRKIIRASFEPLLPGLIRMVYWGMIVLPFCSVAVELIGSHVWGIKMMVPGSFSGKTADIRTFLAGCSSEL